MRNLLIEIRDLKEEIDAFRPMDEGIRRTLQEKLRIEWTYNSNAIEGNTLTLGETAFYLREGLTSEGKPLKDYLEARNHAEAIDGLRDIIERKRDLTEGLIKELHAVLLKGAEFTEAVGRDDQKIRKHVKDEMEKAVSWLHRSEEIHPVERGAIFHYRFVTIHPFDDGNGRLARILMNLILMQAGYPPCIIRMSRRRRYLESLEAADTTGQTDPFVSFMGKELLATERMILGVLRGGETGLPEARMVMSQAERERRIQAVLSNGPLSIGQIHLLVPGIKRPTLKSDLQRLVRSRKVLKRGMGKGVVYS